MANRNLKILFYDADCGFCQFSVYWLKQNLNFKLKTIPYQYKNIAKEYPMVNLLLKNKEIQLFENNKIFSGAKAVARCLKYKKSYICKIFANLIEFSFFLPFANILYKIIANNRRLISKILKLESCKLNI